MHCMRRPTETSTDKDNLRAEKETQQANKRKRLAGRAGDAVARRNRFGGYSSVFFSAMDENEFVVVRAARAR